MNIEKIYRNNLKNCVLVEWLYWHTSFKLCLVCCWHLFCQRTYKVKSRSWLCENNYLLPVNKTLERNLFIKIESFRLRCSIFTVWLNYSWTSYSYQCIAYIQHKVCILSDIKKCWENGKIWSLLYFI